MPDMIKMEQSLDETVYHLEQEVKDVQRQVENISDRLFSVAKTSVAEPISSCPISIHGRLKDLSYDLKRINEELAILSNNIFNPDTSTPNV